MKLLFKFRIRPVRIAETICVPVERVDEIRVGSNPKVVLDDGREFTPLADSGIRVVREPEPALVQRG